MSCVICVTGMTSIGGSGMRTVRRRATAGIARREIIFT
eukprot:CAMPEP_0185002990 /NCGR_PEP_ID=MMETSP1098-20130426/75281_1 /TAXON_ID=89044 /ORGANISM="Spumella elongata, Strain CCAP 955/1" /LENGTH=37 /DNA_ID= /DNA_START= /DNA_END= /DNA_ORIENTATION=